MTKQIALIDADELTAEMNHTVIMLLTNCVVEKCH